MTKHPTYNNWSKFFIVAIKEIFSALLRRKIASRMPTVEHISENEVIIFTLFKGYKFSLF